MNNELSLEKVERKTFRSVYQAGIVDIMFGSLLALFAVISVMEWLGISRFAGYPLLVIPLLIHWLGRKYITNPRLGMVKFGAKRKRRSRLVLWITVGVVLLMAPVVVMTIAGGISHSSTWMFVAAIGAPLLLLGVYAADLPRLYLYAAIILAAVVESEMLRPYISEPLLQIICFGLPGLIILGLGIWLLTKFLGRYPLTADRSENV